MDFVSPPAVVAALRERAAHGVFGYALVPDSLIDAIRAHLVACYGWRIEPDWLVWLPSVVPGLNLACRAFAGPGEAVMTVTPVYPPFLEAPPDQGRRLVTVPAAFAGGRWQLPLEAMEAAVTPDTRVLLFCHPHNPLGRVWSKDEVAAVVHFCRRHALVLCSDEIHCDLILDELAHVPAAGRGASAVSRLLRHRRRRGGLSRGKRLARRAPRLPARQSRPGRALRRRVAAPRDDDARRGHIPGLAGRARARPRGRRQGLPEGGSGAVARGRLRRPGLPAPQLRLHPQHPAGGAAPPAGRLGLSDTAWAMAYRSDCRMRRKRTRAYRRRRLLSTRSTRARSRAAWPWRPTASPTTRRRRARGSAATPAASWRSTTAEPPHASRGPDQHDVGAPAREDPALYHAGDGVELDLETLRV